MNICRFNKKHINELEISKEEKAEMFNYYALYLKGDVSPAFTVKVAGKAQGMAGIRLISRYIGEAWVRFNPIFLYEHKKVIAVKIKDYIDFIGITFKLKKIQAIIDIDRDIDKRFIEFLGFKYDKKLETGFDIYMKGV